MSVPYNDWLATLTRKAALREKAGLRRSAAPRAAAVDLAGNDYLGLSSHPRVLAAASQALADFGLGATGSRLVRGTTQLHEELELALAAWIGTERALVYSSGYLANLGAIRALAGLSPKTLLVSDAHCHASMIDGCRLAGAETVVFEHGSADHAASLLQPGRPNVILTESVFSVDGDLAPLKELHDVARSHGALLLVDDAHGLGVTDAVSFLAGEPDVVITATLSKALGGAGGVVAGPSPLIAHLIDTSRTFIFDTALPPAVAAGVLVALEIARDADDLRLELHRRARLLAALPGSSFPAGGHVAESLIENDGRTPFSMSGFGTHPPAGAGGGYVADLGNGNVAPATETLRDPGTHSPAGRYDAASLTKNDGRTPFSMSGFGAHSPAGSAVEEGAGGAREGAGGAREGAGGAREGGDKSGGPPGGVVSLTAPSAEAALAWATACREKGVAVGCFRPPSTPDSRSRLRLTVNAGVPYEDFMHALEVIERCRPSAD